MLEKLKWNGKMGYKQKHGYEKKREAPSMLAQPLWRPPFFSADSER